MTYKEKLTDISILYPTKTDDKRKRSRQDSIVLQQITPTREKGRREEKNKWANRKGGKRVFIGRYPNVAADAIRLHVFLIN